MNTPRTQCMVAAVLHSLEMCPMVTVVIVVLRLRSLQLGGGLGEPEAPVETCMYIAFICLTTRMLCSAFGASQMPLEDSSAGDEDPAEEPDRGAGPPSASTAFIATAVGATHMACTLLVYFSVFRMLV